MLVFSSHIADPAPSCCPDGEAVDGVEPFLIRPTEIINQRLTEVIAIRERFSGDCYNSRVDRFDASAQSSVAAPSVKFVAKFRFEQLIGFLCLRHALYLHDPVPCFTQQTRALQTRPGPHTCKSAIDRTPCGEAVKRGIDPA